MKSKNKEHVTAEDMVNKLGLKKLNSFLDSVILRNWILPISITLILGTALKLLFIVMGWNEFLAGYYTCLGWFISHRISSI